MHFLASGRLDYCVLRLHIATLVIKPFMTQQFKFNLLPGTERLNICST